MQFNNIKLNDLDESGDEIEDTTHDDPNDIAVYEYVEVPTVNETNSVCDCDDERTYLVCSKQSETNQEKKTCTWKNKTVSIPDNHFDVRFPDPPEKLHSPLEYFNLFTDSIVYSKAICLLALQRQQKDSTNIRSEL